MHRNERGRLGFGPAPVFFTPLTDSRRNTLNFDFESALAIADIDQALKLRPTLASALYGRGVAKIKKGENADGEADVSAAKAIKPNVAEEFARYGISL